MMVSHRVTYIGLTLLRHEADLTLKFEYLSLLDMPGKRTFQEKDDKGVIKTVPMKVQLQSKRFKLHMCYPVNVFLPDARNLERTGHLSPDDVAMLKCLVKSHIPLIILDDSGKCYQDIVKKEEDVEDNEDNEDNNDIKTWKNYNNQVRKSENFQIYR